MPASSGRSSTRSRAETWRPCWPSPTPRSSSGRPRAASRAGRPRTAATTVFARTWPTSRASGRSCDPSPTSSSSWTTAWCAPAASTPGASAGSSTRRPGGCGACATGASSRARSTRRGARRTRPPACHGRRAGERPRVAPRRRARDGRVRVMTVEPNQHDRFILRQRIRPVINQYEIFLPGPDGADLGDPVCFVEQARFKFKEDIRFYADDSKHVELMRLKARQRFDPRARYDVTDDAGGKIGEIQKVFGESLLRSTYRMYGPAGDEVASARERSLVVALLRRLGGFIPYAGDYREWLPRPDHFCF